MPIHDWTRAPVGVFHDFHLAWMVMLQRALNGGLLPERTYATVEAVECGTEWNDGD